MTTNEQTNPDPTDEPLSDPGASEEYPLARAARIASRFALPRPIEAFEFAEKGNINQDTFLLACGRHGEAGEFLLQRINQQVFTRPQRVMKAMIACLDAQRRGIAARVLPGGRRWEAIELVPTRDRAPYLRCEDRRGTTVWRLMKRISGCRSYKSLSEITTRDEQLQTAEEVGRGLALFGDFVADIDVSRLRTPLPGYRDTRTYYAQLHSVLAGHRDLDAAGEFLPQNEEVLQSSAQHFLLHIPDEEFDRRRGDPAVERAIRLALDSERFALSLQEDMEQGRIRTTAVHGDTKIENFLFDAENGHVRALVDLDTIVPHTWLSDWGDMIRSLVNVAGEKEPEMANVQVDLEIYRAVAAGFLGTARAITESEIARMVDAVEIIALELGIRFLSDYLRGDSYFKLTAADPPALNKIRALVQLTLVERLRAVASEARAAIDLLVAKRSGATAASPATSERSNASEDGDA